MDSIDQPLLPPTRLVSTNFGDGILYLWLNRPDHRNAMSSGLVDEFEGVVQAVTDDRSVRAMVVRGAGGVFCAGGDLNEFTALRSSHIGHDDLAATNRRFGRLMEVLLDLGAVLITVVEQAAIGGGFGLACAADIVIAERNAVFSMSETSLGLVPAQIAPIVARRVGVPTACRLALTGDRFDAVEAHRLGLVDHVAADVDRTLLDVISQVRKCAPGANAATKRLMQQLPGHPEGRFLDHAADVFADVLAGDEARQGIAAFLNRRPAPWQHGNGGVAP